MHFVLILIAAALNVYAQAAPQFNSFNSRNWKSTGAISQGEGQTNNENHNQKFDVIRQDFTSQSTFTGHRGSNDYGRQTRQNYQGSSNRCWDPVNQNYRDRPSNPQHTHHTDQFNNYNFPIRSNYNRSMYRNHYREDRYHGTQRGRFEPQSSPYNRGHGPPQHDHHQHRPPQDASHHHHRPPPHNHDHHHHHETPPQNHGHGHAPHHHQHGRPSLTPRPPRPSHNGNEYGLEICEETTKEKNVFDNPETSTSANSDVDNIPSSLPVSSSSITTEILTESTSAGKLIESTTQFDWNNYFPDDNRGSEDTEGIGIIDVRIGDVQPV